MYIVFVLVSILFFVLVLIALIKPELLNKMNASLSKSYKEQTKIQLIKSNSIPLIICLILVFFTWPNSDESKNLSKNSNNVTQQKVIPGLQPVDVYLNMEKNGFETIKNLGSEYGNSWESKKSYDGFDYSVKIFSSNASTVESIKATAILKDIRSGNIDNSKQFFIYVSSIPYDGSNPAEIKNWLMKNFNKDKTSITISNVKYTLLAPTKMVRTLLIEKE